MSTQPEIVYLKDYKVPEYLIPRVHLDFDLHEDHTTVTSTLTMKKSPHVRDGEPLVLDGVHLKLLSLKIDGRTLDVAEFKRDDEKLTLLKPPAAFELQVVTEIRPQDNQAFSGLYKTKKIFCTQMEAQGFRHVTYFLDRPDVMSIYTTSIRADKKLYPFLLSNGDMTEKEELPNGRHRVTWHDPFPKPSYLFALVAGDLGLVRDSYTTASGRTVALEIFTDKGNEPRCTHAMRSLKESMKWDEDVYGLEYDLNVYMIVAVDDFNMGAMENKGLNIFNSKYVLADSQSATDQEFLAIQGVIGHEYFHNWSGNRVTCRDWFQLSLKEGLTVFRDQEFTSDLNSRAVKRLEDVTALRSRQFPEDSSGMAHPVRPPSYIAIDNFYTRTVYDKGSEVIRMLQTLLGRDMFIAGVKKYFQLFDGQAVTTDDFIKAHELTTGRDLTQFKRWYDQAGTPVVKVKESYSAAKREYKITLSQTCIHPVTKEKQKSFHMPIRFGLISEQGRELPLPEPYGKGVLELKETQEEFVITNVAEKPTLSILREFSAPIQLDFEQSDTDLIRLMEKDSDGFNRFEAAQRLFKKIILDAIYDFKRDSRPAFSPDILAAFKRTLGESMPADKAFLAKLIAPPSVSYLLQFTNPMEPVLAEKAYEFFISTIQKECGPRLLELFRQSQDVRPSSDTDAASWRAFKNVLLTYLTWGPGEGKTELLRDCYLKAENMTDAMGALCLILHKTGPYSEEVSQHFFDKWKNDSLVLNKWFTAQALSLRPDTLNIVEKLTRHPSFDKTNPNKLFALVFTFATSNPFRFHEESGRAYEFIKDMILDVDSRNPQVAARLATSFNEWTRWSPTLRALAQKQLRAIKASAKVSKNVFEIVDRALDMA